VFNSVTLTQSQLATGCDYNFSLTCRVGDTILFQLLVKLIRDYKNSSLNRERPKVLKEEMIATLQADLQDPEYLAEIAEWDQLSVDGIDA
jgi:hypothetical protein